MAKVFTPQDQLSFQFKKPLGVFISMAHLMQQTRKLIKDSGIGFASGKPFSFSEALRITWSEYHNAVARWLKGEAFEFPAFAFETVS